MENKKYPTVCYQLKDSEGGNQYLSYYCFKPIEEVELEVAEINATKPSKLWNGQNIDWTKVDHFFVHMQELMED